MRRQLFPALAMVVVLTLLTGVAYPLVMTGLARVFFADEAGGSLVERDGEVVGSRLVGQRFTRPEYFHPRPSAAGPAGYDGALSAGSNYGPTNEEFLATVAERVADYRAQNDLPLDAEVPVDAVTASGSGLDPQISRANARVQARRVAAARGMNLDDVLELVDANTDERALGFLGEPGVNVLLLNLALDERDT